ncbi:MAG: hypothetical protein ACREJN_21535 [Nitrospiraceae bacterium]
MKPKFCPNLSVQQALYIHQWAIIGIQFHDGAIVFETYVEQTEYLDAVWNDVRPQDIRNRPARIPTEMDEK